MSIYERGALAAQHVPFAPVLADLDRFKQLNDTHGHEAGDRARRLFSQVVHGVVRGEDIVPRLGGEEFVIVLPGLDEGQAVNVLERLRTARGAAHAGDHPTASSGVTDSSHGSNLDEILRCRSRPLRLEPDRSGQDHDRQARSDSGLALNLAFAREPGYSAA